MSTIINVTENVRVVKITVTDEGNTVVLQPVVTIGGGGSGAVWGGITGTLSDQTDLQNALNAKANVSGQVFTGAISATNLSGTNTGDQDISGIATNASAIIDLQNDKQNKIGTTSYATLTGAVNVDVSALADDVYYLLTGNTTITWTNTPALGQSFIRSFIIKSTTAETLTLPVANISKGTYANDGSENQITVKFSNFATEGLKIVQFINNA